MPRQTYAAVPIEGDYILRFTGLTWNVLRRTGAEGSLSISTGDRTRKAALARMRTLTESDQADGWEADGPDLFRQVTRFRR